MRPPKNKSERKAVHETRDDAIKFKGQPLVLERNEKVMPANGIVERSMFHCQRPMSVTNAMFDNS